MPDMPEMPSMPEIILLNLASAPRLVNNEGFANGGLQNLRTYMTPSSVKGDFYATRYNLQNLN